MPNIADLYTNAVYDNLRPLRANWEPAQPIRLGDYGLMIGQTFVRQGCVADLGIEAGKSIVDHVGDQKLFTSGRDVNIEFTGKGTAAASPAVDAKASLHVSFASADTTFFNAAQCSYEILADKTALGVQIMAAFKDGRWKRQWAVVTDLVRSQATTIAISLAAGASFAVEATGDVAQLDLANASIGLTFKGARNVGYQIVAAQGLTPLIGVSQIQSIFLWWSDRFKPLSSMMLADPRRIIELQNSPAVETEPEGQVYFAQLL